MGALERIMNRVEKTSSCWIWRGYLNRDGYGRVGVDGGTKLTHRAVYELMVTAIPAGLQIDHLCRNRACVNPKHLEPVDARTNMQRAGSYRRVTHCVNGHEYTDGNTYTHTTNGKTTRWCRICKAGNR